MLSEPLVKLNSVYVKVQEALLHLRGDLLVGDTGVVGKAVGGTARIFDGSAFYAQQARQILSKFGVDAHLYLPGVPILGPELAGSTFANAAGWSFSGGVLTASSAVAFSTASNSGFLGVQMGKSYQVTYTANVTSGSARLQFVGGTAYNSTYATASGTLSEVYVPSENKAVINVQAGASGFTGTISGLTVREILGYTNYLNGFAAGNYLESTGNTNASVDGAVGLVLDAAGTVGPELVVSGDFSNGTTGWVGQGATISSYGERLSVTTSSGAGGAWQDVPTVAGKTYQVFAGFYSAISASLKVYVGGAFATLIYNGSDAAAIRQERAVFQAVSSSSRIYLRNTGISTCEYDNISVRELTGIHATQATTANKPTLRRGIVNLQPYANVSSGLSSVPYGGGSSGAASTPVVTPNYAADPFGGNTACRVQFNLNGGTTTGDRAYLTGQPIAIDNVVRTSAVWVKANSGTATILTQINGTSAYVTVDTSEWKLLVVSGSSSGDSTHNLVEIRGGQTPTNSNTADLLVATHGIFQGTLTAQQIIAAGGIPLTTTAPASSQYGAYAWEFDGGNDSLPLPGPLFQMTDDHCVIAAYNPTAIQRTYFSPSYTSNTHRIATLSYTTPGQHFVEWYDGTNYVVHQLLGSLNVPVVISARKSSATLSSRCNGTQFGSSAAFATAVNGTSAGIGAPILGAWSGKGYPVIAIKGTVSDAELRVLEKWLGSIAGVAIA